MAPGDAAALLKPLKPRLIGALAKGILRVQEGGIVRLGVKAGRFVHPQAGRMGSYWRGARAGQQVPSQFATQQRAAAS